MTAITKNYNHARTRIVSNAINTKCSYYTGIGYKISEWIRKEDERRKQRVVERQNSKIQQPSTIKGFISQTYNGRRTYQLHGKAHASRKICRVQLNPTSSKYPNFVARLIEKENDENR